MPLGPLARMGLAAMQERGTMLIRGELRQMSLGGVVG